MSRRDGGEAYPLSPLQQGMLVQALLAPDAGVDIEQLVFTLREPLHVDAMREAFRRLSEHHPVLRTAFRWEGLEAPQQLVSPHVELPFRHESFIGQPPAAIEAALARHLRDDRRLGFALDRPPLQRVAVFTLGERDHRLIWTFHHLLLDGWSLPIVLDEVFPVGRERLFDRAEVLLDVLPGRGERLVDR